MNSDRSRFFKEIGIISFIVNSSSKSKSVNALFILSNFPLLSKFVFNWEQEAIVNADNNRIIRDKDNYSTL